MNEDQVLSNKAAREVMAKCYARGSADSFKEFMLRKVQDPLEPTDAKGRRRFHPVLVSFIAYGALMAAAIAGILFFWRS